MFKKTLFIALVFLMAGIISPAFAQDDEEIATQAEENGISIEAIEDETITEDDLEAQTPGTFGFFKKFTRTIQRVVTRDPVKKAELRLEDANEELLRARQIARENPDDDRAQERTQKALEKFENSVSKVQNHVQDIKERTPEKADDFLKKVTDFQIKQQKVLDEIEDKMPPEIFTKVKDTREKILEHAGQIIANIQENPEELQERINEVLQNQAGSDFKEFKNIEVLEGLLEKVPPQARQAIEQAKENSRLRLEQKLSEHSADPEKAQRFQNYIEQIPGDAVRHLKIIDELKSKADIPEEFFEKIEEARSKALNKFEEKYRRLNDSQARENFVSGLQDGDIDNLRILRQINENVPQDLKADIEKYELNSIEKFKQEFADDPNAQARAEKFRELSVKLRENPDPDTFAAITKLRQSLPANQADFVDSLENEAIQGFAQNFAENGQNFAERIKSFNPQSIEILSGIQEKAPQFSAIVGQVIDKQIDFTKQRLENIDNPVEFEKLKDTINNNQQIRGKIEQRLGNIGEIIENREEIIGEIRNKIENTFNARIEEEKKIRQEQGLSDFTDGELENIKRRFLLKPQTDATESIKERARDRIEILKDDFIENIPQVRPNENRNNNPIRNQEDFRLEQEIKPDERQFDHRQEVRQEPPRQEPIRDGNREPGNNDRSNFPPPPNQQARPLEQLKDRIIERLPKPEDGERQDPEPREFNDEPKHEQIEPKPAQ